MKKTMLALGIQYHCSGKMHFYSEECLTISPFIFQFSVISDVAGCLVKSIKLFTLCSKKKFYLQAQMYRQLAGTTCAQTQLKETNRSSKPTAHCISHNPHNNSTHPHLMTRWGMTHDHLQAFRQFGSLNHKGTASLCM